MFKTRKFFAVVLIMAVASPLFPGKKEKEDVAFTLLKYTAGQSILLDTALTYDAIWNHGMVEGNPMIAWYIENPYVTITFDVAAIVGMNLAANWLYKKGRPGKVLAYALVIGVCIIQAHTFYTHWWVRNH